MNTDNIRLPRYSLKQVLGIAIIPTIIIAAVVSIYFTRGSWSGGSEREAVFGGWVYSADDQRVVSTTLAKARFSDYRWENNRLEVPAARRARCEQILSENRVLPSSPSDVKRDAIEEISSFESESKTRMRDLYSSARQLEQTLARFEPIESATVGVCTRRERGELSPRTVTTATIGIRTSAEEGLTPELVSSVTLAAKHQLGIARNEDISIMDLRSGRSFLGDDRAVGQCGTMLLSEERRRVEEHWEGKFQAALGEIPGLKVTPSIELAASGAELSPENAPRESQSAPPDGENQESQTFSESQKTAGDRPTLGPLGDDQLPSLAQGGEAGTLVFRPNSIAEVPASMRPLPGSGPMTRLEKMTVVLSVPRSYVRQKGQEVLETIRRTAGALADSAVGCPENRAIQINLYDDEDTGTRQAAAGEPAFPEDTAGNNTAGNNTAGEPNAGVSFREKAAPWLTRASALCGRLKNHLPLIAAIGAAALLIAAARVVSSIRTKRRNTVPAVPPRSKEQKRPRPEREESELCEEVIDHVQRDPKRTAEILERWIQTGA